MCRDKWEYTISWAEPFQARLRSLPSQPTHLTAFFTLAWMQSDTATRGRRSESDWSPTDLHFSLPPSKVFNTRHIFPQKLGLLVLFCWSISISFKFWQKESVRKSNVEHKWAFKRVLLVHYYMLPYIFLPDMNLIREYWSDSGASNNTCAIHCFKNCILLTLHGSGVQTLLRSSKNPVSNK